MRSIVSLGVPLCLHSSAGFVRLDYQMSNAGWYGVTLTDGGLCYV